MPRQFTAASGSLPSWVVGMSIFATFVSSISFLGLPGDCIFRELEPVRIQPFDTYSHMACSKGLHSALQRHQQRIGLPLPGAEVRLLGQMLCRGLLPSHPDGKDRLDSPPACPPDKHDVRLGHTDHNNRYKAWSHSFTLL